MESVFKTKSKALVITGLIFRMFHFLRCRSGTNRELIFNSFYGYLGILFQNIRNVYSYTNTDPKKFTRTVPCTRVPCLHSEVGRQFGIPNSYSEGPGTEPWYMSRMFLLATRLSQTNSGLCLSYSAKMMIKILNIFPQNITQTTNEASLHELKVSKPETRMVFPDCLEVNTFLHLTAYVLSCALFPPQALVYRCILYFVTL